MLMAWRRVLMRIKLRVIVEDNREDKEDQDRKIRGG